MTTYTWNPWHGCRRISEGCLNCYVYRIDGTFERDSSNVVRNADFDLPIRTKRGSPALSWGSEVFACMSSDFFLDEADSWRAEAWSLIAARPDIQFNIITKRILRFYHQLPGDWGDGYPNVTIWCTCENQARADERLPFFLDAPIRHRRIVCEPMLEYVDFTKYLLPNKIDGVSVGGESGQNARVCSYEWVKKVQSDCVNAKVKFSYHQTGAKLEKDGIIYCIPRKHQHEQARRAGLDT